MNIYSINEAKTRLASIIDEAADTYDPVFIKNKLGKPHCVIVSRESYEYLLDEAWGHSVPETERALTDTELDNMEGGVVMKIYNVNEAETRLSRIVDELEGLYEPVYIRNKSDKPHGVILSKRNYESLLETAYIRSIPGMEESLNEQVNPEDCVPHEVVMKLFDSEEQEEMKQEEFSEGRAEGKIEGRTEAKTEVARNLLLQGVSIDIIEKATGLSEKEITSLQKDSNSYRNNNNESKEQ